MIPGRLTVEVLPESGTITRECAIDRTTGLLILKDPPKATVPPGGRLSITQTVDYAYGMAFSASIRDALVAAFGPATDGDRRMLIADESIMRSTEAQRRADAEIASQESLQIEGSFRTETQGIVPGQRLEVRWLEQGISGFVFVNQVSVQFLAGGRPEYTISFGPREQVSAALLSARSAGRAASPKRPAPLAVIEFP